ncbi:MAG: (d)CMP kinase [Bifidobacteriaceae bacterium]|jgi:cytidylate kinase|nr:(d)CMP kinase [Bifidobacteriaceae bacterium]
MTVIAIDGPSGSGKSTVAKALATQLGWAYLDTGAMYRAAAVWVRRAGALDSPERMPELVRDMPLRISLDPGDQRVFLGDDPVTDVIRSSEVSALVSKVSTVIPVRQVLVARQRELVAERREAGIVVEGRDITTVVAPDAEVRVLIAASPEVRLRRRALDQLGRGDADALAATADEVLRRDRDDATVAEFMAAPPGVTLVDSSDLTVDETVAAVAALLPERA